ncbi:hypothetical protein JCM8547_006073 [Rhodosporidiobolus lusitaniae]
MPHLVEHIAPSSVDTFPPPSDLSSLKAPYRSSVVKAPSPPSSHTSSPSSSPTFSLSSLSLSPPLESTEKHLPSTFTSKPKRIGIIGAGTGGIGVLLAMLDLPEEVRREWTIEVLEKRGDVGGVWLPDEKEHGPDDLPDTPLYPALHTNTAIPTMTYTGYPFASNTPLCPSHTHIYSYLSSVVQRSNLTPYLRFNHAVEHASYDTERKKWVVQVAHSAEPGEEEKGGPWVEVKEYDHLVIATGRYHHPSIPHWPGEEEWLTGAEEEAGEKREITHSLWYRGPGKYARRTVVVVGFGASGWDITTQVAGVAETTYHSYTPHPESPTQLPPVPHTIHKPRISHFTPSSVVFTDGTSLASTPTSPISIVLATGYKLSIPFLSPHLLHSLVPLDPKNPPEELSTNGTYLRPLFRSLLSLDPRLPSNALGIVGLPWFIAAGQASYMQGLVLAHAFANDEEERLLPEGTRVGALRELQEEEERTRKEDGVEPFGVGHKFLNPGAAESYQDSLLSLLRSHSLIPLPPQHTSPSTPYVPTWRRWGRAQTIRLRKAFLAAVEEGVEEQFRANAKAKEEEGGEYPSEEEWVGAMERLIEWFEGKEREEEGRKGGEGGKEEEERTAEKQSLVVLAEK